MSDDLIHHLVRDLTPVARLASPLRRTLYFAVASAPVTLLLAAHSGLRADLHTKLSDPAFAFETLSLLAVFVGAAVATLASAIPGISPKSALRVTALGASAWLLLTAIVFLTALGSSPTTALNAPDALNAPAAFDAPDALDALSAPDALNALKSIAAARGPSFVASGRACVGRTLLLAAPPMLLLLTMVRRSRPAHLAHPRRSGALVALSAGTLAILGTRLVCSKDGAVHVLTWHATPLVVFALAGWIWGRSLVGGVVDGAA